MNLSKLLSCIAAVVITLTLTLPLSAVTIFLAEEGPGMSAPLSNPSVTLAPGAATTLHVYVVPDSGDAPFDTIAVNLDAATAGIVSASSFSVATPDITVAGVDVGDRWDGTGGMTAAAGGTSLIVNMNGVAVTETGLDVDNDGSGLFLDEGFDSTAGASGAFHFGSITLSADALGMTDLFLSTGSTKIVREGDTPASPAMVTFGASDTAVSGGTTGATGTVADAKVTVIPEPTSWLLLVIAVVVLGIFRKSVG